MVLAWLQQTRMQACETWPEPTGCESWKPTERPCLLRPVNQPMLSGTLRFLVIWFVWLAPHFTPMVSLPRGVGVPYFLPFFLPFTLPVHGNLSTWPSVQVAATLPAATSTARCLM